MRKTKRTSSKKSTHKSSRNTMSRKSSTSFGTHNPMHKGIKFDSPITHEIKQIQNWVDKSMKISGVPMQHYADMRISQLRKTHKKNK